MTSPASPLPLEPRLGTRIRWMVADTAVMTRRNLLRYVRLPENLVNLTVQPIMFLLLFTYVLGGAIRVSTPDYVTFLLPGILVQTLVFGSMNTALGLAQDVQSGLFDRYRSLPMARVAVVAGRLISDTMANLFITALMVSVGVLIGFRFGGGLLPSAGALAVAILFALPLSGLFAAIGLFVRTVESVNVVGFIAVFPLTFISSAFVPVETMPSWLRPVADANPFTMAVNTSRALALGQDATADFLRTLAWVAALTTAAVAAALYAYNRQR